MRVALHMLEDRSLLLGKMAEDARQAGKPAAASSYEARAAECGGYADTLRRGIGEAPSATASGA